MRMSSKTEARSPQGERVSAHGAAVAAALATYQLLKTQRLFILSLAAFATASAFVLDILTGPSFLTPMEVIATILHPDEADKTTRAIVHAIRLPMSLMAAIVGAGLGIAGVVMQTILGNPLASPYTLGFSAAAGFGAATAILTGLTLPVWPVMTTPLAAFLAAACAAMIVYGFSHFRAMSPEVMVLAGIATLFLFQSLQSMVQYLASPEVLQQIVSWLFGSMMKANWANVPIAGVIVLIASLLIVPHVWHLTALRMGDDHAAAVGVNVGRLRIKMFAIVALLTAGAVSFVGTIGFVGLVAPHLARMLVGEDQRILIPLSALVGAFMMVAASILSKLISPGGVIPIGIVTAVVGVPFLFLLIIKHQKRYW